MKNQQEQWWSCDGKGVAGLESGTEVSPMDNSDHGRDARETHGRDAHATSDTASGISRRAMLYGAALSTISWLAGQNSALAQLSVNPNRGVRGDTLVVIFLRGGMDGLNVVVPYREDEYFKARPSLKLAAPNSGPNADRVLDLDGNFGFNPALAPWLPLYKDGKLAVLHAVGSQDQTRSHFEAMTAMEKGLARAGTGAASGWLARFLNESKPAESSPLRAVAFSPTMPDSLRGATSAIALTSLEEFRLATDRARAEAFGSSLKRMYDVDNDAVTQAGKETLDVLETLNRLDLKSYKSSGGAAYPTSDLGNGLKQVAMLLKAEVGLEVAALDKGGWDTHVAQGASSGWMTLLLDDLAKSVRAFVDDMGPTMNRVTVVVMTEFGRRVEENAGYGTDHGRGSAMFVFGGNVDGGKVHVDWPSLATDKLEGPGDLRVTTDYRSVLSELLAKRMATSDSSGIFPGFTPNPVGVFRA
ncbi:MAG: DUF1501 domain-containing protein [Fimbriimonadaceae bacterium]|nr:DUF1501 domain-containing protein [Fimbriimonadaceae bacterium]